MKIALFFKAPAIERFHGLTGTVRKLKLDCRTRVAGRILGET
jgi:hypothetical protein